MADADERDGWVSRSMNLKKAKAGHRSRLARQFGRAVIRAELDTDKLTLHTMRRTAITQLVRVGVDLPTIQRISGHKRIAVVLRYVHLQLDHGNASLAVPDAPLPGTITQGLCIPIVPGKPEGAAVVAISSAR